MNIKRIDKLDQAEIERMLHTGKITTTFHLDDLFIHYEFTTEDQSYIMCVRGLVGEESRRICTRDFVNLLIGACFSGAVYEHDAEKEARYEAEKRACRELEEIETQESLSG